MTTGTVLGPQGPNATTTLPAGSANNRWGNGVDTWVKDASTATSCDGTVLDAAFFNNIIGSLRTVIDKAITAGAPITKTDGDITLLYDAIIALIQTEVTTATGGTYLSVLTGGTAYTAA